MTELEETLAVLDAIVGEPFIADWDAWTAAEYQKFVYAFMREMYATP